MYIHDPYFFDGLCAPKNPNGIATYGFVIFQDKEKVAEKKGVVGEGQGMTNNVAEYSGILNAVEYSMKNFPDETHYLVSGDSQLIIRQLNGDYKVKSATAQKFQPLIMDLLKTKKVTFSWIPREENALADSLTKQAYFEYVSKKKAN